MKSLARVSFLVLTALAALAARSAATEVETTPLANVLPVTPTNYTLWNTTGITITDTNGTWLYLYQSGGYNVPSASCPVGDKIIAYRALVTNGVPGSFQRVGRISPCVNSPVGSSAVYMGAGQVLKATVTSGLSCGGSAPYLKYELLADASDSYTFHDVWRGESCDGINWTWYISSYINNSQFNGVAKHRSVGTRPPDVATCIRRQTT